MTTRTASDDSPVSLILKRFFELLGSHPSMKTQIIEDLISLLQEGNLSSTKLVSEILKPSGE